MMGVEIGDFMEYKVVAKKYVSELENAINELIKEGWEPQGGIAYSKYPINSTKYEYKYLQAMIKNK